LVTDNGTPKSGADGKPISLIVFFPANEATIIDTWHTMGMRGTGSSDVRVERIFIPERRCWRIAPVRLGIRPLAARCTAWASGQSGR
jgi:alkylation response protein AidB-like acyl-CoA dehydrogenase